MNTPPPPLSPSDAPPEVPIVSFRAPSVEGAPITFSGPPGTQLSIPAPPPPVWQWLAAHGVQIAIVIVVAMLFARHVASEALVEKIFLALIVAQLQPIRVGGGRQVLATMAGSK